MIFGASLADDGGPAPTLLVTAHPDDETMFFAPSLLCLADTLELHILCLSTGNFDGIGAVRELELPRACARLGVPPGRVSVLDDPQLRDGPHELWPAEHIARVVEKVLVACKAERIITFDAGGISRHANHTATHAGVQLLAAQRQAQRPLRTYELRTLGLIRRHLGVIDVAVSLIGWWLGSMLTALAPSDGASADALCVSLSPWKVHSAMVQHRSQYVWFRRLYLLVSRYVWLNTLVRTA